MAASAKVTWKMNTDYNDVSLAIWCFEGMLLLQVKEGAKPYKAPLQHMADAFQEPFWKELDHLKQQKINLCSTIIDMTLEWYNILVLEHKPYCTVSLC